MSTLGANRLLRITHTTLTVYYADQGGGDIGQRVEQVSVCSFLPSLASNIPKPVIIQSPLDHIRRGVRVLHWYGTEGREDAHRIDPKHEHIYVSNKSI